MHVPYNIVNVVQTHQVMPKTKWKAGTGWIASRAFSDQLPDQLSDQLSDQLPDEPTSTPSMPHHQHHAHSSTLAMPHHQHHAHSPGNAAVGDASPSQQATPHQQQHTHSAHIPSNSAAGASQHSTPHQQHHSRSPHSPHSPHSPAGDAVASTWTAHLTLHSAISSSVHVLPQHEASLPQHEASTISEVTTHASSLDAASLHGQWLTP